MKLTVLGKYGPYPKSGDGAASGYLIEENGTKIVLDMGSGSLSRLQEATDINQLDAVFISHLHYDHTSDLLVFRYLLEELNKKITILTQFEDSEWYRLLFSHPLFNIVNIDESSTLNIGSLELTFFEMKHTSRDFAVKIKGEKTFVYTGDTLFTPKLYSALEGTDAVLCDCSKPDGFTGPHMTVNNALDIQEKTGVKIIATHLSPDYSPEEEFRCNEMIEVAQEKQIYII